MSFPSTLVVATADMAFVTGFVTTAPGSSTPPPSINSADCPTAVQNIDALAGKELRGAFGTLQELADQGTPTDGGVTEATLDPSAVLTGVRADYNGYERILLVQNSDDGYVITGFDRSRETGDTEVLPVLKVHAGDSTNASDSVLEVMNPSAEGAYDEAPKFIDEHTDTAASRVPGDGMCKPGLIHRCVSYDLSCLKRAASKTANGWCGKLPKTAAIACFVAVLAGRASRCCTKYVCTPPNMV